VRTAFAALAAAALGSLALAASEGWMPAVAAGGTAAVEASGDSPRLVLKRSPYGKVLFSGGYALYVFTRDNGKSNCDGDCAEAWPPLLGRAGDVRAGDGVRTSLLGTVGREDGSKQITYRGRPLYFYEHDPRGEVLCHDVREFGGKWFAVRRNGRTAPH
jgi:predicted lipoprotein with Yx(FWY)xxD motif